MKFQLTDLSVDEINTILGGLLELPGKFSFNLINKIRTQTQEQGATENQPPGTVVNPAVPETATVFNNDGRLN